MNIVSLGLLLLMMIPHERGILLSIYMVPVSKVPLETVPISVVSYSSYHQYIFKIEF